ncbi:hypothetical protein [Desulfovibrio sp. UCD-KL4C]|uniref:hypothetical protein n=1 Tax=Desulfovibrio sp. UCD-KL4C TaxID=2578120 RepID=UPI0025BA29BB|nr:hypothetical protein [Desulfovibrio sp. UCD-KL4C]
MLRKKGFCIAGFLVVAILSGSIMLVRANFVDAVQGLLSQMTEMGVVMEDIEIHYSPLPYLLVHNLEIKKSTESIRIPLLEIYPDIASIFSGNIKLRHVILQDPDIHTEAYYSEGGSSTFEIPAIFPAKLDIVSGKVLLTNNVQRQPVTVSAIMEKEGDGFAFNVHSASIAELGFKFSGKLEMQSSSPLKLNLQATECSIDPAAFLGFLTGFGYLSNSTIPELAEASKFETRNLDFSVDSTVGSMRFQAGDLVLDSNNGKNLSVEIKPGGSYQISLDEIKIDAGELYSMAQKSERGRNATLALCKMANLKSIKPKGKLILKSVSLSSPVSSVNNSYSAGLTGRMTVSAKDLALRLESNEGRIQELTISDVDVDVEIKNGKPVVSVRKFNVASVTGGDCNLQAAFAVPLEVRKVLVKVDARDFSLFDYIITGKVEKKNSLKTVFDTQLLNKGTKISASGYLNSIYSKKNGFDAVLSSLSIQNSKQSETVSTNNKFDFSALLAGKLDGKALIRKFYFNDWPLSAVTVYLKSNADKAVLKASAKLFRLNVNAEAVLSKDNVAVQCGVKGRGESLPNLIACFAKDLSVAIRGKVYLNADVFISGKDPIQLAESAKGDGTVLINNLQIKNLTNLDPRLGFFIDIVDAVSKKSKDGDGLNFSSARLRCSLSGKEIAINSFALKGNVLQAWGGGSYSMGESRLKLDGKVRSVLGIVNSVNIDRKLKS